MKVTKKMIVNALTQASEAYRAREGERAVLNRDGVQPDVASGIATVNAMTDAQFDAVNAYGLGKDFMQALKVAPVKVCKRLPQLFVFLASGDHRALKGSARTFVLATGALALCDVKSVEGLRYVATGAGDMNTSDAVSIEKVRANISRILGKTAPASFATQYSVAYGKNGLGGLLGVGVKGATRGALPTLNRESAVCVATLAALANLSAIAVADLSKDETGEGSGE